MCFTYPSVMLYPYAAWSSFALVASTTSSTAYSVTMLSFFNILFNA